jgi:hypothetical protein
LWEGANFKLKIRNVEGYRNYDKSEFAVKGALFEDDDKLEAIYKQEHSLKEFTDKKHFKPYEQLKARLDKVLGFEGDAVPNIRAEDVELPTPVTRAKAPASTSVDDDLDYFKSLAEQE